MKDNSQTDRLILAILALVVGLFMFSVAQFLIQTSLERGLVLPQPKFKSALMRGEQ